MVYFLVSLLIAFIGAVPLLLRRKNELAIVQFIITALFTWLIIYAANPSTVWPLFGLPGVFIVIWWILASLIDGVQEENPTWIIVFPVVSVFIYIIVAISGSVIFHAATYANMIGTLEEREWTQDVQPKDPAHMRMATEENAIYRAKNFVGAAGAIGSQFVVSEENMTLQMINKELWYVVPLDFASFNVWSSSKGSPGYIKVHGEDPHREPELVMLKDNEYMQYTPGAFFGYNLERHLRNNGYLGKALSDWTFEIDDSGKMWWVVTVYKPTIAWWGEKIDGVVVVDPVTGSHAFYPLGSIPEWVDRADPGWITANYLEWRGTYSGGWWNSVWAKRGLTKPEKPNLIYGTGDQPEWVIGITSSNDKDNSLIALVYTNSRTGKSVLYKMAGGGTDSAVLDAVNKNSQVQYKHLHGVAPQLYNVYGIPTSVVPLLSGNHAYQGVAMVSIRDIQTVAVGNNQYEAFRNYEKLISEAGQRLAVDKERSLKTIEGIVDRFSSEVTSTGSVYYLHLPGIPHLFTAGAGESPKLPVTKEGDKVRIEYYESDRDVVPIHKFDNFSFQLSESKVQKQVREKVGERRDLQEKREDANTAIERLKQMDPKDLQELLKQLPPKK